MVPAAPAAGRRNDQITERQSTTVLVTTTVPVEDLAVFEIVEPVSSFSSSPGEDTATNAPPVVIPPARNLAVQLSEASANAHLNARIVNVESLEREGGILFKGEADVDMIKEWRFFNCCFLCGSSSNPVRSYIVVQRNKIFVFDGGANVDARGQHYKYVIRLPYNTVLRRVAFEFRKNGEELIQQETVSLKITVKDVYHVRYKLTVYVDLSRRGEGGAQRPQTIVEEDSGAAMLRNQQDAAEQAEEV